MTRRFLVFCTTGVRAHEGGTMSASPGPGGPFSYGRESGKEVPAAAYSGVSFQAAPWTTVGIPAAVRIAAASWLFPKSGAAHGDKPLFERFSRRKSEDRETERRLGQKDVRGRSLRRPGRRRGAPLEIPGVEKRAPGLFESDLRGPEDVTRGKESQPRRSGLRRFAVSERAGDSDPLGVPPPVERDRLRRRPDLRVPCDGVVRMRMRKDRPLHRRRRVQECPERRSIKALGPGFQEREETLAHPARNINRLPFCNRQREQILRFAQDDRESGLPLNPITAHPIDRRDAAGGRGARSLPEGRSLAPRERSACGGSGGRSRPHPAESPAGAQKGADPTQARSDD